MIGMSSSARSFGSLAHYLATGRSGDEPERVSWTASRNLPTDDPELAGKIMRATASQNARVKQPVYHLALSFDPQDAVDRTAMERVADRVISRLKLDGHQAIIVCHRDRGHPHVHLLVNRVHPETGRVWNRWQDRAVIQKVLREEEIALGFRAVPGRLRERKHVQQELFERPALPDSEKQSHDRVQHREAERASPSPRLSRTEELTNHLQTYERILDLTSQQYGAQLDASAARLRATQLEEIVERAQRQKVTFERALAQVYREPSVALGRFLTMIDNDGPVKALQSLRARPEEFGALITVVKPRALGIIASEDDTGAHTAAIRAAVIGQAQLETAKAMEKVATTLQQGPEQATRTRRATLNTPGTNPWRLASEISPATLAASRKELELATSRQTAIHRSLRGTPERDELERQIVDLFYRMSPRELRQVRRTLTAPQIALAQKLKAVVRDTILARDEAYQGEK
jgi:hypothetical protein